MTGIEAMEFGASVLGAETPVDGGVAPDLIRIDSTGQYHFVTVVSLWKASS